MCCAGSGTTGGGAGGRVSITYTDSEYTGTHIAYGGASDYSYGGAGTVYVKAGTKRKLYIDNKNPYTVPVCNR